MGLHRDLKLDSVSSRPYTAEELERIDLFAEEIANEKRLELIIPSVKPILRETCLPPHLQSVPIL